MTKLGGQPLSRFIRAGAGHQPDRPRSNPLGISDRSGPFFKAPLAHWLASRGNRTAKRLDLTGQRANFCLGQGVRGRVTEACQCRIFKPLCNAKQAWKAKSPELFGEAIERHRKLDELLETTGPDVIAPARA